MGHNKSCEKWNGEKKGKRIQMGSDCKHDLKPILKLNHITTTPNHKYDFR